MVQGWRGHKDSETLRILEVKKTHRHHNWPQYTCCVKPIIMRMNGLKVKVGLSFILLIALLIAWGLLSLHRSPLHHDNVEPINVIQQFSQDNSIQNSSGPRNALRIGNCSIPYVPIRNKAWNKYRRPYSLPNCSINTDDELSSFSEQEELIVTNLSNYKYCCYREISRSEFSENDGFKKSPDCKPYEKATMLKDIEFFATECTTGQQTRSEFHANIPIKKNVVEKVDYWKQQEETPISVAMIVLDSVSRRHFERSLPKTLMLLEKMDFIDFKGHHLLGEPTMPNAIPLLLGAVSAKEFSKTKKWKEHWDNYDFIWKKFAAVKYITLYAEDMPEMATFNYGGQGGFNEAPTDFYPRPLFLAHKEYSSSKESDYCFGNETAPEFLLDYHFRFMKKLESTPTFSINWISRPQHDIMEALETLDDPLFNYFHKLSKSPSILDNTLVIFTSDHGFWMHEPYSRTHEGLLERRMPMLFLRMPQKLANKHPDFLTNAKTNTHRITSHHDTFWTLSHIAQLASEKIKKRKKVPPSTTDFRFSLFTPIPITRTCQRQAKIPPSVCICNLPPPPENPSEENEPPKLVQLPNGAAGAFP